MADADPFAQYVAPDPTPAAGDDPFAQYVAPAPSSSAPAAAASTRTPAPAIPDPSFGQAVKAGLRDVAAPVVDAWNTLGAAGAGMIGAVRHPVDTARAIDANPMAAAREGMRGVNDNIPFANSAVEAIGGPVADSPEDAAAFPNARGIGNIAGYPAASMVGGIAAKGIEAAAPVVGRAAKAIGEGAQDRQIARAKEALEMRVKPRTRAGLRTDAVDNAIVDNPALRKAAGNDAETTRVAGAMKQQGQAQLAPIYAKSGPADEAVAKAVGNVDERIAALKKGDANDRAAAVKLQRLRDEFNDSFGGRETTTAAELRAEQSAYQKNGYAKNINADPEVAANILAQREMSKAVGDAVIEHVTGMDYAAAKAAAAANPSSVAGRLLKANEQINAANRIEASIADRAGRQQPKHGLLKTAAEIKHSPAGYVLSKVPEAAAAAGSVADNALARLAAPRTSAAAKLPTPLISEAASWAGDARPAAPAAPPTQRQRPTVGPGQIAKLLQLARSGATRQQLAAQAQQDGTPPELAANIAQQFGR